MRSLPSIPSIRRKKGMGSPRQTHSPSTFGGGTAGPVDSLDLVPRMGPVDSLELSLCADVEAPPADVAPDGAAVLSPVSLPPAPDASLVESSPVGVATEGPQPPRAKSASISAETFIPKTLAQSAEPKHPPRRTSVSDRVPVSHVELAP